MVFFIDKAFLLTKPFYCYKSQEFMDHIIGQIESIEQIEIKPTEPIEPGLRLFFFICPIQYALVISFGGSSKYPEKVFCHPLVAEEQKKQTRLFFMAPQRYKKYGFGYKCGVNCCRNNHHACKWYPGTVSPSIYNCFFFFDSFLYFSSFLLLLYG